jgi:hydrogenase expression/formation protein HypE
LDPIHVANEGTMVIAVPQGLARRVIDVLRRVPETAHAIAIGRVESRGLAAVVVERGTRQKIPLDEPVGAPLPRIC